LRFLVDHCVPVEVARWLTSDGHEAWTAYEAGLGDAQDDELIAYAYDRRAVLVTTNRDCAQLGRRMRSSSLIWLAVREPDALTAMGRALEWQVANTLPAGRVLKVFKVSVPQLLAPIPL
jgi:predicted nuclease of predicted toxin-antitoxin system